MNPAKSFPIEQSYINLAIIETKEQQEKEKKLLNANNDTNEIIGTFEEIYGTKDKIEIKSIFEKCTDQTNNILVLGRAGIGKTTFCRYVAYQWATGKIWQQYHLVIFIRLRNLTESRYPPLAPGTKYSLIDLVKTEYFHHGLSEENEKLLKEELNKSQVLWFLDGYDEIVQNIPPHLQYLLEQLLKTPHHILTSRPYLITLSYKVQLEITGFTDDNIKEYVKQFFDQIKDEIDNALLQAQKLLSFLESNPRIWGIVHIPVNLELMCSLWCDTDWSETTTLTMTTVYDKMIEWLCRRHLEKQNISSSQMTKEDVYTYLHKELAFLESLAFNGMESKSIILPPKLLRIASKESECSLHQQSHLLNIGILKSLDYKPIGTRIEADKSHYFLHLSFQEHFAARYLAQALNGAPYQKKKAIDFIKTNKYNQRFELVFTFASGLLIDYDGEQGMNLFWETLLGEPVDLIGLRHVQLVISCLEETSCSTGISQYREAMDIIIKWINYSVSTKHNYSYNALLLSLRTSPSLVNQPEILVTLLNLYEDKHLSIKQNAYSFLCALPISSPYLDLIQLHLTALDDMHVRSSALEALANMGEKAATNEVIDRLLIALGDTNQYVSISTYEALAKTGGKAVTNVMITRLLSQLGDTDDRIRNSAYQDLDKMGEKAATIETINRLLFLLGDTNRDVRNSAYEALDKMAGKVTSDEMINRLFVLLGEADAGLRDSACEALSKMGEKAATNGVIKRLVTLLDDRDDTIKRKACIAVSKIGEKAVTSEVINGLLNLLDNTNELVRTSAYLALGRMGEKAATKEVINRLLDLLNNTEWTVKGTACLALSNMGEKVAIDAVINRLLFLLGDVYPYVRSSAYQALEKMAGKVTSDEMINKILFLLGDRDEGVRSSAYEALEKMTGKAVSDEVINRLLLLLDDADEGVRESACQALNKMGEKEAINKVTNRLSVLLDYTDSGANINMNEEFDKMGGKTATNGGINILLALLGHTEEGVRNSAYQALEKMTGKAVSDEVISRLLILLGDTDKGVRNSAYQALDKMVEKTTTDAVINELLILLGDTDGGVRSSAYEALDKVIEKTATDAVINKLLILLGDRDGGVRSSAYEALDKVIEKTANDAVINRLLILLGDTDKDVRNSAYEALDKMVEKTTTDAVINRLLILFGGRDGGVGSSAYEALDKVIEKTANDAVINRLLILLDDTDKSVRNSACKALGMMGEKAATDAIINRLLILLRDRDEGVRSSAYVVLGKMGKKAATNEVIGALLDVYEDMDVKMVFEADFVMENIFDLLPCMSALKDDTVHKLLEYTSGRTFRWVLNISPKKFIEAFLNTKIRFWLPIIRNVFVRQGYAITVTGTTIVVHDRKEAVPVSFSSTEVGEELQEYFFNWLDKSSEKCEVMEETIAIKSLGLDDLYD